MNRRGNNNVYMHIKVTYDTDKKFFDDDQKLLGLIHQVNRDYGGTEDFFVDIAVELVLERRSLLDRKVT